MFNIREFVSEFEIKASSSITTHHEKLESQQHKVKETEVIICEGISRKRLVEQLITSFDTITNKRHKKEIFERRLAMVIENSSVEDNDNNKVTLAEAEHYNKKIMQISSTKSTHNTDVCSTLPPTVMVLQMLLHFDTIL